LGEGELGAHLTQCGQGRRLPHYQVASLIHPEAWPQQVWTADYTDAGAAPVNFECGCCCASFVGELDPHVTQCGRGRGMQVYLHAKFCLDPSKRLAIVHQRHRRADRIDNGRPMERINRNQNVGLCPTYGRPQNTGGALC